MTPGPVTISDEVSTALAQQMLFHRSDVFRALYSRVCTKLLDAFGASPAYRTLILSGSGTLANEAVLSSVFGSGDRVLVLANGDFGERLIQILEVHDIEFESLRWPWATAFDLAAVDRALADPTVTGVAMVAMETSTGMVNPVREVGRRCRITGRVFFVDAISALGAEDLAVERDSIDLCTAVPNKGLEGPPGLALVCARREILEHRRPLHPRSIYLDLYRYLDFAANDQTPTTPAVPLIVGLEAALDKLAREGLAMRRARYQELSRMVRAEATRLGIKPLLPEEADCATAVTTLCLPAQVNAEELQHYLAEQGITIWHPLHPGPLAPYNVIQVSVMGAVRQQEVEYFLDLLRAYLGVG